MFVLSHGRGLPAQTRRPYGRVLGPASEQTDEWWGASVPRVHKQSGRDGALSSPDRTSPTGPTSRSMARSADPPDGHAILVRNCVPQRADGANPDLHRNPANWARGIPRRVAGTDRRGP